MDRPNTADIKADFRRSFRWQYLLPNLLWVIAILESRRHLLNPATVGNSRLFWILLPLPLIAWAYWAWRAQETRQDELQRAINGRVAIASMRFTVFWLFTLVLVDAVVGIPFRIPAPFGLPDDSFGMLEVALVPLLFSVITGALETKKVFPRK